LRNLLSSNNEGTFMERMYPPAQVLIAILPIVAVVSVSVLLFFFLLWRHREIMCRIKANDSSLHVFNFKVFSLLCGILLTALGVVLTPIFLFSLKNVYSLLGGLIPLSLGIGLLLFYKAVKNNKDF